MRLTEREMTVAIETVAKQLFAATRPPWKRDAEAAWLELTPLARYQHKAAVGDAVLPVLMALPEPVQTVGRRSFTDEQYAEAVGPVLQRRVETQEPGAWEAMSEKRRRREIKAMAELTRLAVEALPERRAPDDLVVPDHL